MTNPFEALGERQISAPRKARLRAAEKRREKKQIEQDVLFDLWKQWHDKKRQELLAGPHAAAAAVLADFVERMTLQQDKELIALMRPWRGTDAETRYRVLQLVDHTIIALRERAGLAPFDDLDDSAAFLTIRRLLSC